MTSRTGDGAWIPLDRSKNVFGQGGTDIGTRAGVMKRQVGGGGSGGAGTTSVQMVEERTGAGAAHPAGAQLRRRLGRADLRAVPESRRASPTAAAAPAAPGDGGARSEEHTSELQSRENLVCRLLLEKKKSQTISRRKKRMIAAERASEAFSVQCTYSTTRSRMISLMTSTRRACGKSSAEFGNT